MRVEERNFFYIERANYQFLVVRIRKSITDQVSEVLDVQADIAPLTIYFSIGISHPPPPDPQAFYRHISQLA